MIFSAETSLPNPENPPLQLRLLPFWEWQLRRKILIECAAPVGLLQPGRNRPDIVLVGGAACFEEAPLVQCRVDLGDDRFPAGTPKPSNGQKCTCARLAGISRSQTTRADRHGWTWLRNPVQRTETRFSPWPSTVRRGAITTVLRCADCVRERNRHRYADRLSASGA